MAKETLSEQERGLVACAIRYGPFPPKPEHLPACERLGERGWLDHVSIPDFDMPVFALSAQGYAALELDGLRSPEFGPADLN